MMLNPVPITPSLSFPLYIMLVGIVLDFAFDAIIYLVCMFMYSKMTLHETRLPKFKSLIAAQLEKHASSIGLHFIVGTISDAIGVYIFQQYFYALYLRGPTAAIVYWWILFAIFLAILQGITLVYTLRYFPVKKGLSILLGVILFSTVTNPINFARFWIEPLHIPCCS